MKKIPAKKMHNKITILYFFLVFIICLITNNVFGKNQRDSCNFSEVYYQQYIHAKNIKVLSDTFHFNGFILFKFIKVDSSRLFFEVYFTQKLKNVYDFEKMYKLIIDNKYLYAFEVDNDNLGSKFVTLGSNQKSQIKSIWFDRLINDQDIKESIQIQQFWTYSSKTKSKFAIFKTSFDGILIINDLLTWKEEDYSDDDFQKNVKVLIPYVRYIPLEILNDKELLRAGFFRTSCPDM